MKAANMQIAIGSSVRRGTRWVRSFASCVVWSLVGGLVWAPVAGRAENWGHWRGPDGNGTAVGNPPVEWSGTRNVKWKTAIPGSGSGSPIVWGDRVFVVTAAPGAVNAAQLQFQLLCLDRTTGKVQWQRTAVQAKPHQETHQTNTHASASPCTDGEHVYAFFGSRGLYCYTLDGELKWQRDFGRMNTRNSFGEGSSPTLSGEYLIVPWDHEGPSALYALNKRTGETVWETPRDEPTNWGTPLVVAHAGREQVVITGQKYARSYDLKTGRELWRCGGQTERPCAPAVAADGLVFVGSGFRGAFLGAFRLDGSGDIQGTDHVAWTVSRDTPDVASPVLSQGRLYYYKARTGLLTCVDAATGHPHFASIRVPGVNETYASPVAAGGRIYLTDRSGTTTVIEDAPEFKVLATNKLDEGVDATPAVAGDELFIRSAGHLFCIAAGE
jgi:outer membrane protein assembly factor BamB